MPSQKSGAKDRPFAQNQPAKPSFERKGCRGEMVRGAALNAPLEWGEVLAGRQLFAAGYRRYNRCGAQPAHFEL